MEADDGEPGGQAAGGSRARAQSGRMPSIAATGSVVGTEAVGSPARGGSGETTGATRKAAVMTGFAGSSKPDRAWRAAAQPQAMARTRIQMRSRAVIAGAGR